jgi:hypothetical protein
VIRRRPNKPFWENVRVGAPGECWPWLGYKRPSGHGLTCYKSMPIHASRKAWILTKGEIRGGLCVNHRCDNAECCNPAHMYLGTRADNMRDYWGVTPVEEIYKARKNGASLRECAERFGLHISTICRVCGSNNPLCGPHCSVGRVLRNNAIDEICKETA